MPDPSASPDRGRDIIAEFADPRGGPDPLAHTWPEGQRPADLNELNLLQRLPLDGMGTPVHPEIATDVQLAQLGTAVKNLQPRPDSGVQVALIEAEDGSGLQVYKAALAGDAR